MPLGTGLAIAARCGRQRRVEPVELIRPLGRLLGIMAGCAFLAGLAGFALAATGGIQLASPYANRVPEDRHVAFLVCGFAHGASYLSGLLGGLILCGRVWRSRRDSAPRMAVGSHSD